MSAAEVGVAIFVAWVSVADFVVRFKRYCVDLRLS